MNRQHPLSVFLSRPLRDHSNTKNAELIVAVGISISCSVVLLWPLLTTSSWYVANQAYRYPYLLGMFREQISNGHLYPRWLPHLAGGYGYPTFVFYPPGFWFVSLPLSLMGLDDVAASKAALLLILSLGGVGGYKLARSFCGRGYAVTGTVCFYLTPYIAKQLYERGSLAELAASVLCPWVMYHLLGISRDILHNRNVSRHCGWFAFGGAAVIYSHPMVAAWLGLALAACIVGMAIDCGRLWRLPGVSAAAIGLSVVMASPFWFPAWHLRGAVAFQNAISHLHMANTSISVMLSQEAQLIGPYLPWLACVGFIWSSRSYFVIAAAAVYLILLAYMTPMFLAVRQEFVILHYLQMPLRVLSVAATLQLIGMACLLGRLERLTGALVGPIVAIGITAILATSQLPRYHLQGTLDFDAFRHARQDAFETMTHLNEFAPVGSEKRGLAIRHAGDPIAIGSLATTATIIDHRDETDVRLNTSSEGPGNIIVNQFYFPGWEVDTDGAPAERCPIDSFGKSSFCSGPNGRIAVSIPHNGRHLVRVYYAGVPNSALLTGLAVGAAITSLAILLYPARRCSRDQSVAQAVC